MFFKKRLLKLKPDQEPLVKFKQARSDGYYLCKVFYNGLWYKIDKASQKKEEAEHLAVEALRLLSLGLEYMTNLTVEPNQKSKKLKI